MEKTDVGQIYNEDPLAIYRPFFDSLNRILDIAGEAAILQEFVRDPRSARILQSAYRAAFQHAKDISKLSPELLVGYQDLALKISVIIKLSLPPKQRPNGYIDLGEHIPQAYVDWLLTRPNPFQSFVSDLLIIEEGRLCSAEIERRGNERLELDELLKYKSATPKREALKYLQERTPYERAHLAKKYGLEVLSQLEKAMGDSVNDLTKLFTEGLGVKEGTTAYGKLIYALSNGFPEIEKKMVAEIVKKSLADAKLEKRIVLQCDRLIRCIAIDRFGLSIKNGYSLQKNEADSALLKLGEIVGIKGMARNYVDILDRGVTIFEAEGQLVNSTAEMEALNGLYEGADYWSEKEINDIILAGLEDKLSASLKRVVSNNLIDVARIARRLEEHEVTDSQIDAQREAQEKESDTPFFDTIPSLEPMLKEPVDLKDLSLNIDALTPRELWVMQDVYEGLNEGYDFGSKLGGSFRQRWGKDYEKNIKAFNRAKAKLTKH